MWAGMLSLHAEKPLLAACCSGCVAHGAPRLRHVAGGGSAGGEGSGGAEGSEGEHVAGGEAEARLRAGGGGRGPGGAEGGGGEGGTGGLPGVLSGGGEAASEEESHPGVHGGRRRQASGVGVKAEGEEYLARYGPPQVPLPQSLERSPLVLALKLSPRYMGEGVREAAQELFSSPVFLSSVALSVLVYFTAWLAPEPLFSKAFAATLTLRLALAVGVWELTELAHACVRLYQEAEAARTVEELEAVAERFGRAMGGTALRVLVLVASMGVGRGLPQVPEGGVWALLRSPRYAMGGGATLEGATSVRMVADGTIIVAGVAAGTGASSLVGSACADGLEKKEGHQWHHLATNKNETSTVYGGPWTPRFEKLFAKAGMSLDAAENLVYLAGHQGPHPEDYHLVVHQRLEAAIGDCQTVAECRSRLVRALKRLADEVCTPGSSLHQLVTKS
jgi:hypothetical protein